MFVRKSKYEAAVAELERVRQTLASLGAGTLSEVQRRIEEETLRLQRIEGDVAAQETALQQLRGQVVHFEEALLLQEVGLYRFSHPLEESVAYKVHLADLDAQIKDLVRRDAAVACTNNWSVNGSEAQGRRLVKEVSRILLSAYNAEVENVIRVLRPHRLDAALDRIGKLRERIARNAKVMDITITTEYHRLRLEEIRLTADYLQKVEDEKEAMREERERLREAQKAQREIEAEQARLEREADKYRSALARLASSESPEADTLRASLAEVENAIGGLAERAANIRAGFVYVISNIGSFGEDVVKIGLTRRLDPEERIRELSDASVPFNFDKHAIIFSHDAVGLESRLHGHFGEQRINRVNLRREFFRATPTQVLQAIEAFGGEILTEFRELPEALEWHQSRNTAT